MTPEPVIGPRFARTRWAQSALHADPRALIRREHARHGEWGACMIVEERVGPTEPAQPPAEQGWHAEGNEAQRAWWRRVRRKRPDRGALEDSAKRRAEQLIPGAAAGIQAHERMNESDDREARTGSIADGGPATIRVPSEDLAGELQAAHRVRACCQLHTARRHVEDIRSSRCIEHVRSFEEARKCLAVAAVTNETEPGVRCNFVCGTTHVAAPATKRESIRVLRHGHSLVDPRHGRACPGHPRLSCCRRPKTWMPGTSPGMTNLKPYFIGCFLIHILRNASSHVSKEGAI
jgi:hypothetical protein